jgi:heme/copper-type cytochrome/quinol oxidase subunit 2
VESNLGRVVLGIVVLAVAVVLLIVLKDDSGSDTSGGATTAEQTNAKADGKATLPSEPSVPTVVIAGGQPVGGVEELVVEAGDRVRFKVRSDVSDEVHVHGYDIAKDVVAGATVEFDFPASIEGVFEAELEERGEQIVELRIEP